MANYCIIPDTKNNIIELTNKDCEITLKSTVIALPTLPNHHNFTHYTGGADPLTPADIGAQPTGNYIIEGDIRLSDNRYPLAHNSTHFLGGSDPISYSDIGAQNEWENPVFVSNSFNAVSGKNYIIKSQIGVSLTPQIINDPSPANVGDFYILYHEGGKYVSIGGIIYSSPGTLLARVYEAVGLSGQWKTRILNQTRTQAAAWVNFNGSTTPITIRDSYNIASITDNGVGDYTINFINPFPNTNYCFVTWSRDWNNDNNIVNGLAARSTTAKTISSVRILNNYIINGNNYDSTECNIIFFGGV